MKVIFVIVGDEIKESLENLSSKKKELLIRSKDVVGEIEKFSDDNSALLRDIGCVRGVTQYTVWLQLVQELNTDLETAVEGGVREQMVKGFISIRNVDQELSDSKVVIVNPELIIYTLNFSAFI